MCSSLGRSGKGSVDKRYVSRNPLSSSYFHNVSVIK